MSHRLTVLMTCFNAGRFLEPAIRSIVNQTFRDWEFLIVDDASSDGSAEISANWADNEPRIRVIRNTVNKGQTACLNQGLREARGEWIARQDADDLSHPLRFARQMETLTACPEIVVLGTAGRMLDSDDRLCGLLDVPLTWETIRRAVGFLNPFLHTSVVFRRGVILTEFGGYDERFRIAQDYDLWSRVMSRHPVGNLALRLVGYRHLESSLSKAGRSEALGEAREIAGRQSVSSPHRQVFLDFLGGVNASSRNAFRAAFADVGKGLSGGDRTEWNRLGAALHLRMAGFMAGESRMAAVSECLFAMRDSPEFAIHWLKERYWDR